MENKIYNSQTVEFNDVVELIREIRQDKKDFKTYEFKDIAEKVIFNPLLQKYNYYKEKFIEMNDKEKGSFSKSAFNKLVLELIEEQKYSQEALNYVLFEEESLKDEENIEDEL